MNVFREPNQSNKLFFTNYKRIDEKTVFNNIKYILEQNPDIIINNKKTGPSEDIYECRLNDESFDLIYDIDYGGFIYSSSDKVIEKLEKLLNV